MSRKISDEYQKTTVNFIGLEDGVTYVNTRGTAAKVGCVGGTIKICGFDLGRGPGVVPPGGSVVVTRDRGYLNFAAVMEWPEDYLVRRKINADQLKGWTEIRGDTPMVPGRKLRDALLEAGSITRAESTSLNVPGGGSVTVDTTVRSSSTEWTEVRNRSFIRLIGSIAWRLLVVMVVVGVTVVVLAGGRV